MPFTCDTVEEPTIRAKLERISKIRSLVATMCLPNIHRKDKLESPPQFVAATRGTIVPMLSAPSMNCGIGVFTTNLTREDFSPEFLKTFASNLRREVAPRVTKTRSFFKWLGIHLVAGLPSKYDITRDELDDFFLNGARAALKKYNLPEHELKNIEYNGGTLSDAEKKEIDLRRLVPRSSYINGRHEMGYNFGGNHFLEIHFVERIVDPKNAEKIGIHQNQLILFYHGGGGHATYHLGRYFARRAKNTTSERFVLFFLKLLFHFGSLEGIKNFPARWHAYFSSAPFPEIPLDSPEGQRLFQSIKIGLNYGYGFRVALLRRIHDALPRGSASFLWDAAHNSITEEDSQVGKLVVHRQDAMHVFPDKPIAIIGRNNTLSCIGIGSRGGAASLWSATPSATQVIEQYINEGKSKPETPEHVSYISKRKNSDLVATEHVTSEGLFDVVHKLEKSDIIKPVAYTRPLGSIKGH